MAPIIVSYLQYPVWLFHQLEICESSFILVLLVIFPLCYQNCVFTLTFSLHLTPMIWDTNLNFLWLWCLYRRISHQNTDSQGHEGNEDSFASSYFERKDDLVEICILSWIFYESFYLSNESWISSGHNFGKNLSFLMIWIARFIW